MRKIPEKGRRVQRPKCCNKNNPDESSPNNINNNNNDFFDIVGVLSGLI